MFRKVDKEVTGQIWLLTGCLHGFYIWLLIMGTPVLVCHLSTALLLRPC